MNLSLEFTSICIWVIVLTFALDFLDYYVKLHSFKYLIHPLYFIPFLLRITVEIAIAYYLPQIARMEHLIIPTFFKSLIAVVTFNTILQSFMVTFAGKTDIDLGKSLQAARNTLIDEIREREAEKRVARDFEQVQTKSQRLIESFSPRELKSKLFFYYDHKYPPTGSEEERAKNKAIKEMIEGEWQKSKSTLTEAEFCSRWLVRESEKFADALLERK